MLISFFICRLCSRDSPEEFNKSVSSANFSLYLKSVLEHLSI
nr:MAG TPA: hypothetical protein [Caudoviricetes sp.]